MQDKLSEIRRMELLQAGLAICGCIALIPAALDVLTTAGMAELVSDTWRTHSLNAGMMLLLATVMVSVFNYQRTRGDAFADKPRAVRNRHRLYVAFWNNVGITGIAVAVVILRAGTDAESRMFDIFAYVLLPILVFINWQSYWAMKRAQSGDADD